MDWTNGKVRGRIWRFAQCEYDEIERRLWVNGKLAELTDKPLDVLAALLRSPQRMLTRDQLIGIVWPDFGDSDGNEEGSLTQAVRQLRRAFKLEDRNAIIRTIHGVGYEIVVPVATRTNEKCVEPQVRLVEGTFIPGKGEWKLMRPLDTLAPHWVWQAEKPDTRQIRVFKFAEDGVRLEALQREITLSRFFEKTLPDSSSFVKVHDWRLTTKPYLIESEYGGLNLEEWAISQREGGGLSRADCLQVVADLAETVGAAHNLGVLHNDLKPSNVLISPAPGGGAGWKVKVCDFGIASPREPEQLAQRLEALNITNLGFGHPGVAGGSALYRAPEIRPGQPSTAAADIYALGVILFQLLCGDFRQTPAPGWQEQIDDPLLREDIEATVNLNPKLRLQNAFELAHQLRTLESRRAEQERSARKASEDARLLQQVERDRARRPYLIGAVVALTLGLGASLWFYKRAADERDRAASLNIKLSSMDSFLRDDILRLSNPLRGQSTSGAVQQETLLDAINTAIPRIDQRFRDAPEIAGQLHEEIADALDARTEYAAAAKEFAIAAERFRTADGPLSQRAIIAELRRENAQLQTRDPATIQLANAGFAEQQARMARLPQKTPELQAWYAFAQAAPASLGAHPESALPLLKQAIAQAEKTTDFSPQLLIGMKIRLALLYEALNDAPNAERASREVIASIIALEGLDSHSLFQAEMALDQALYLENKMEEAKERTGRDYETFLKALGPDNQLTLAALYMHAEAEASLGDRDNAIRDLLALYAAERSNPSGKYLQEDSLSTAASLECQMGRFASGIEHARQALKESSAESAPQPIFVNTSKFAIAECLISQQEASGTRPDQRILNAADILLKAVNLPLVKQAPGLSNFEGAMDVAAARLALLRGDKEAARTYAEKAEPFAKTAESDPYENQALARVISSLDHSGQ